MRLYSSPRPIKTPEDIFANRIRFSEMRKRFSGKSSVIPQGSDAYYEAKPNCNTALELLKKKNMIGSMEADTKDVVVPEGHAFVFNTEIFECQESLSMYYKIKWLYLMNGATFEDRVYFSFMLGGKVDPMNLIPFVGLVRLD